MPWHHEIEDLAKEYIATVVDVAHLDMYIADGWVELQRFIEKGTAVGCTTTPPRVMVEIRKRFSS